MRVGRCLTGIHSRARRRGWITNKTDSSNPETTPVSFFLKHSSYLRGSNHRSPGTDWIPIVMYSSSTSVLQHHEGTPFKICDNPRPRIRVAVVVVGERVEGVKDMSNHDRLDSRKLRLLKKKNTNWRSSPPLVHSTLRTTLALLCQSAGRGTIEKQRRGSKSEREEGEVESVNS